MAARKSKVRISRRTAVKRRVRLLKDRAAVKLLREHYHGYEAKAGYSLDLKKLAKLPESKKRALRKKAAKTAQLLATPHVLVPARSKQQAKILRRETHRREKGLKHFIVHVPDPKRSRAAIVDGKLQITTDYPGQVEYEERFFRFPRRARSPDDMLYMLDKMLPKMPDSGEFIMQTDTYGDTGASALDKRAVRAQLMERLNSYDKEKYGANRFMNRVIGWRWTRSRKKGKIVRHRRSEAREAAREAYRKRREEFKREARDDIQHICEHGRRSGGPCSRCPKGVAVCQYCKTAHRSKLK